jgi:tRNA-splicing ligase RtcB
MVMTDVIDPEKIILYLKKLYVQIDASMGSMTELHKIDGNDLRSLGYPQGPVISVALKIAEEHFADRPRQDVLKLFGEVVENPHPFLTDDILWLVADMLVPKPPIAGREIALKTTGIPFAVFGRNLIDEPAIAQMETACRLAISVAGALMPDAHPGYGLPIGGVLATDNAVIPYGVGVDIGCRMCLSVFDMPGAELKGGKHYFPDLLRHNTVFGAARDYTATEDHAVLHDPAFEQVPFLKALQDHARKQIGTSGGGNHFVEFGIVELFREMPGNAGQPVAAGHYLGLLSHSGSRGLGASIASHYTRIAMQQCLLPSLARQLAWLDLDSDAGREYWTAMHLAGAYASACHHIIHERIAGALRINPMLRIENHHNFAWKETVNDRECIVHRKGATPAHKGHLAVIPGSMTAPGYIVMGKGNASSLCSASHGAGRLMSRTQALGTIKQAEMYAVLEKQGIRLIGGGPDEAPQVYKPITDVMKAQEDLVETIGLFHPKVVRME